MHKSIEPTVAGYSSWIKSSKPTINQLTLSFSSVETQQVSVSRSSIILERVGGLESDVSLVGDAADWFLQRLVVHKVTECLGAQFCVKIHRPCSDFILPTPNWRKLTLSSPVSLSTDWIIGRFPQNVQTILTSRHRSCIIQNTLCFHLVVPANLCMYLVHIAQYQPVCIITVRLWIKLLWVLQRT